jgi:hypothetical protein
VPTGVRTRRARPRGPRPLALAWNGSQRLVPHEEATGFAAHGAATLQETTHRALEVMAGFPQPWWVAGGWALDLFLGRKTRPHADLEISILAADQGALFEHLRGWDLRLAAPGGVAAGMGRELDPASVPSGVGASRSRTPVSS